VLFPAARIDRMDLDSTRSKNAVEKIIHNVETRKTDILIGTQMVTKGLDFEHVRVAGILNADNLINFPDFRAHERTYQLISQVSGRAGRKHNRGKVVLQTSQPEHPLISLICRQDYLTAFNMQMQERRMFSYPPYHRLIKVVVKHKKAETVGIVAETLADLLRMNKSYLILGPEFPLVGRIQLWYQKEIWLKVNRSQMLGDVKVFVNDCIYKIQKESTGTVIYLDVDPY
jgi:primosomal protein N' (replication factor Y) (superfamily II helicase)